MRQENHASPKRGISKMKSQGSEPEDHKILQSQTHPYAGNRLLLNALAVVHGRLRQHRRQILYRVELLRRRFRTRRFNHIQSLGDGQSLRPLVLERPKWDSLLRRRAARLKAEEIARQAKAQVESPVSYTHLRAHETGRKHV